MSDATFARPQGPIRYAVVGLGHIAQAAVLPAFAHAKENSLLAALVSDDAEKLRLLGKKYRVEHTWSYDDYDQCLHSGQIDAVYIALPNQLHCEYSVRAAEAGMHVLCEKPMAVTEEECERMMYAADVSGVKLMVAYRLHLEEANLKAIEIAESGQLGDLRLFSSDFTMTVKPGDIRLRRETGGGTLYDIGVYCINAARNLFRAEPVEVVAFSARGDKARFAEVDEMTTAVLRFPDDRLVHFSCSFGAADVSSFRLIGTEGDLRVDPAYEYQGKLAHHLTVGGKTKKTTFAKRDQFAPELVYFSQCVLEDRVPEPGGREGLADVRVVRALCRSAEIGLPVRLPPFDKRDRPDERQEITRPPVSEPELVHTESPTE